MSIIRAIMIKHMFLLYFYEISPIFQECSAVEFVVNLQHYFHNYFKLINKIKKCFFATVQKNTFHKQRSHIGRYSCTKPMLPLYAWVRCLRA